MPRTRVVRSNRLPALLIGWPLRSVSPVSLARGASPVKERNCLPVRNRAARPTIAVTVGAPTSARPGRLAAEVLTEVRLLTAVRAELVGHAEARADAYRWTDPARLAASLPGLAEVGAPTVTAIVGRAARFRTGKGVPLLYRAGAPGQRDRRDRPQGPADEQGRQPVAAHHPGPGRGPRPPGRPAARADLLHPDGGARRRAPQGLLRGRRPPGRAAARRPGPRHALRRLRHRRHSGRPGHRQADHRRVLDGAARGAGPPTQPQARHQRRGPDDGEGPSASPRGT